VKRFSWLRTALFAVVAASLVGNFFSFGYVLKSQRDMPAMSVLADNAFTAYPDEVRVEFRRLLRENKSKSVAALARLREARRQMASAAGSSPFNEADVAKSMAEVREATQSLQRLMQDLLLEALRTVDGAKSQSEPK